MHCASDFEAGQRRVGGQALAQFKESGGAHGPLVTATEQYHMTSLLKLAANAQNFLGFAPLFKFVVTSSFGAAVEVWRIAIGLNSGGQKTPDDNRAIIILADGLRLHLDAYPPKAGALGSQAATIKHKPPKTGYVQTESLRMEKNPSEDRRLARGSLFFKTNAGSTVPTFDFVWRLLSDPNNGALVMSLARRMSPAGHLLCLTSSWVLFSFLKLVREQSPLISSVFDRMKERDALQLRLTRELRETPTIKPRIALTETKLSGLSIAQARLLHQHPAEAFSWGLQGLVHDLVEALRPSPVHDMVNIAILCVSFIFYVPDDMVTTITKSMGVSAIPQTLATIITSRKRKAQEEKLLAKKRGKKVSDAVTLGQMAAGDDGEIRLLLTQYSLKHLEGSLRILSSDDQRLKYPREIAALMRVHGIAVGHHSELRTREFFTRTGTLEQATLEEQVVDLKWNAAFLTRNGFRGKAMKLLNAIPFPPSGFHGATLQQLLTAHAAHEANSGHEAGYQSLDSTPKLPSLSSSSPSLSSSSSSSPPLSSSSSSGLIEDASFDSGPTPKRRKIESAKSDSDTEESDSDKTDDSD